MKSEKITDEDLAFTLKVYFAIKRKIELSEVEVEIVGKTEKGNNLYRARYLDQDKIMDGAFTDDFLRQLYPFIPKEYRDIQ